ncbi:hypothetical protein L1987_61283 [Smallanthus sonchifolius]|uniref:Uncharacterized protein n=1 Tax=Smallanthus sonchifolius TaxID=185202 RepID=A0ACB9DAA3_9ASTR|nr:hypothetical protein L1987_61283 [Smallanthus sonchifolius]
MPWVGLYTAVASTICILAMSADVIQAFKQWKLWFPNKFFTLNATTITLIAIAMKLPVDLTRLMDDKELLMNIMALGILVITIVVNIVIQANSFSFAMIFLTFSILWPFSVAVTVSPTRKKLEHRYKESKQLISCHLEKRFSFKEHKRHVKKYWMMAETHNPQFVIACTQKQPHNLIKLLEKSKGFSAVVKFDNDLVPPLYPEKTHNCWSLVVVTLTSTAIALPNIANGHLKGLLVDILSACFTNIPRVIEMKCHQHVTEKRGDSIRNAAQLLGKSKKILKILKSRKLPNIDLDSMAYIDKWRLQSKSKVLDGCRRIPNVGKRSITTSISVHSRPYAFFTAYRSINLGNQHLFNMDSSLQLGLKPAYLRTNWNDFLEVLIKPYFWLQLQNPPKVTTSS